ncbi:hypothetical protein AMS68_001599 [Peltaster fructicola]|uniref:Protein AF-9 homolog n=1 Tax=Peltaster fructicola TaxID=286661 RepID=A0A6H0XMU7_9PEZI|nr:hypothetical protein AMS68_001599 [Peltaster fructicola]
MPAPTSKRLKGVKVTRHFIIGNSAVELPHPSFPNPPEGHSKGWRVYIRPLPNGPDITTWLKKVQFKLHFTYNDASRMIEAPGPFEVTETGYGEFGVEIRLYFPSESEQQDRQKRENLVVAERIESIEFNEPTQEMYRSLTSDDQFQWLMTKKGRGKGKKPEYVFEGDIEPSAQLPEKTGREGASGAGAGGTWSKQYERQILAQLGESAKMLDGMIADEKEQLEKRRLRMEELGKRVDAKVA